MTVLDNRGGTKVILHDDSANPHTIENSMRKAYTSLTLRVPSGEYGKRNVSNPQQVGALHLDRITTLEGALPIFAGKELVGSMGISGAPGGDKDAACVQFGIDKIAKGLNQAGLIATHGAAAGSRPRVHCADSALMPASLMTLRQRASSAAIMSRIP